MNLFTRNSPYYHLVKYLLFLLKHPVYMLRLLLNKMSHYVTHHMICGQNPLQVKIETMDICMSQWDDFILSTLHC